MRRSRWVCAVAGALVVAACNESTGPGGNGGQPTESDVVVLNSVSRTIQQFNIVDDQLVPFGQGINLPAQFDGVAIDVLEDLYVTTTSAFGGSQIIFGSLKSGDRTIATFPGVDPGLADAGRGTLILESGGAVAAFVPSRARDHVYVAFPGTATAAQITETAGEFIERAIPVQNFVLAVDANLDDDGGTYQPLGPPRLAFMDLRDGSFFDEVELTGAAGATDAVILFQDVFFLAGGSFDPATFLPAGDGSVATINLQARAVATSAALQGNGIALEVGRDGLGYIVRTQGAGTFDTDVLSFNFGSARFERGPTNPIQPTDASGSPIDCWVVSSEVSGRLLCATFEASAQGRLYLLQNDGTYIDDVAIGAGATDLVVR